MSERQSIFTCKHCRLQAPPGRLHPPRGRRGRQVEPEASWPLPGASATRPPVSDSRILDCYLKRGGVCRYVPLDRKPGADPKKKYRYACRTISSANGDRTTVTDDACFSRHRQGAEHFVLLCASSLRRGRKSRCPLVKSPPCRLINVPRLRAQREMTGTAEDTRYLQRRSDCVVSGHCATKDVTLKHGAPCRFDDYPFSTATFNHAQAGRNDIFNIDIARPCVSPIIQHPHFLTGEHVFLKVVRSGTMSVEQGGQSFTFGSGDVAVLDPQHLFNESYHAPTSLAVLRFPKTALRDRGLRHRFPVVCRADVDSADVRAVRECVLNLTAQAGKASETLLERLSDQCLDLMDVLVSERDSCASHRASVATVLRAKQVIVRRIGDPDLSVARIAEELNMSTSSLTRAMKANGLSPMRYARTLRLEHATRMLAGAPQGAIQQIAFRCGFANAAHFSRAFKERYAITPRAYAARANQATAGSKDESDGTSYALRHPDSSAAAAATISDLPSSWPIGASGERDVGSARSSS
jgi:AraC-like DNA-binding protein